jgi:hypothetical protein
MPAPIAWSTAVRLDRNKPVARVVPDSPGNGTNIADWFDETARRFKSGYVRTTVDSVTLSDASAGPSGGIYYTTGGGVVYQSGETLALSVQPPNFNALTDPQVLNSGIQVVAGALGYPTKFNSNTSIYESVLAFNYGRPAPSASIDNATGFIGLTAVDLALSSNALTDIQSAFTATVAGTIGLNQSAFPPYSDLGSTNGGSYSVGICAGPLASQLFLPAGYQGQYALIGFPVTSSFFNEALAVQIQKITVVYFPGPTPDLQPPVLQITNPAQAGGQPIANWNIPLPMVAQQGNVLTDNFTCVFGVNGKLIDANGTQFGNVDLAPSTMYTGGYNLLNAGIVMPPGSTGSVGVVINYKIAATGSV